MYRCKNRENHKPGEDCEVCMLDRITELEEALEPFAKMGEPDGLGNSTTIRMPTYKEVIAARNAMYGGKDA